MGITIHFQGKLENTKLIHQLIDELSDIADTMKWECTCIDDDWSIPSTATLKVRENEAEIIGHLGLKGVQLKLHRDCESLSIFFDSTGNLSTPIATCMVNEGTLKNENVFSSVKTQFAPPDIHVSIIKLLQFLQKRYIPDLKVSDEGGYWESGNKEKLVEKMSFLQEKMDQVEGMLLSLDLENLELLSSEQLAAILEEKLKTIDRGRIK